MSKTRAFVAIDPDDPLRRRAAALTARLRHLAPQARWVEDENLHLTLLFLGELSDTDLADACAQADWVARANEPFPLRVAGVGAFPDTTRPRAVWLGVQEGEEPLRRLQGDLAEALGDLADRRENRAFAPHWTLGRMSARPGAVSPHFAQTIAGLADHDAGELFVGEIVVYGSELRPQGPEYYVLARRPLGLRGG